MNKGEFVKSYLNQYQECQKEIDEELEELEELKQRGNKLTATISDMPTGSRMVQDNMAQKLVEALVAEKIISQEKIVSKQLKQFEIKNTIRNIDNPYYKKILYERYIKNKSLQDISYDFNKSYDYIKRIHGQAILEVYKVIKK